MGQRLKAYRDRRGGAAALLVGLVIRLLRHTCRFEKIVGARHLTTLSERPMVLSLWHEGTVMGAIFLHRVLRPRGLGVTVLVSLSRDGELVARLARAWRVDLVRGSASRGGPEALRAMYRTIAKGGASPVVIPDGPRGPRRVAKPGAVMLAQLAQVPIVPLSFAARRCWTLGSWDRMIVPKPFTRMVAVAGEPLAIPRQLTDVDKEGERLRLEAVLNRLGAEAEAAVGD